MKTYLAIDIGGTQIKYGLISENGKLLESYKMDTQAYKGGPHILSTVKKLISEFITKHTLSGVAISSAGMVDPVKGEIFYSGPQIPNYAGTKFKCEIESTFGIPCEIENDVNCAGLAEAVSGEGKNSLVTVCLTIGTGIGGCLIINGEVFHGIGNAACEVGYLHISDGSFQDLASTTALVNYVAREHGDNPSNWNGYRIFEEAKQGNTICKEGIDRMVKYLGEGIANICYVVNPQTIILGGGIMEQGDYLYKKLRTSIDNNLVYSLSNNLEVKFAKNKNSAGMFGAFYNFQQKQKL